MTRKDYIAIAGALRDARDCMTVFPHNPDSPDLAAQAIVMDVAQHIAQAMSDDNPRFDQKHFLAVVRGERELNSRPKARRLGSNKGSGYCVGCGHATPLCACVVTA